MSREELNTSLSIYPEPTVADNVVLGAETLIVAFLLLLLLVSLFHHGFPPLKAKQLWVVFLSSFACIFWWLSTLVRHLSFLPFLLPSFPPSFMIQLLFVFLHLQKMKNDN